MDKQFCTKVNETVCVVASDTRGHNKKTAALQDLNIFCIPIHLSNTHQDLMLYNR